MNFSNRFFQRNGSPEQEITECGLGGWVGKVSFDSFHVLCFFKTEIKISFSDTSVFLFFTYPKRYDHLFCEASTLSIKHTFVEAENGLVYDYIHLEIFSAYYFNQVPDTGNSNFGFTLTRTSYSSVDRIGNTACLLNVVC